MFTCTACTKQMAEGGEEVEGARGSRTPSTKVAVKSLTAQIKDMAIKFSAAYRQCKPCTGSSSYKKGHYDIASEGRSSSSTPAWDFTSTGRSDRRFTGVFSGDGNGTRIRTRTPTPIGMDSASCDVLLEDEWVAQVEPGVHITFVSLPNGGNDLKRIRFSREMFNKWQAQRWWGENYDRIMELYNVQRFNQQAVNTPSRSEDEPRDSSYTRLGSARESPMAPSMSKEWTPRNHYKLYSLDPHNNAGSSTYGGCGLRFEAPSMDASRKTTSSSVSVSNASDVEAEWVEQDEPGVFITIRQLADETRELRRVRFSRERFGEVNAKTWWEENRERIQSQYL